MDATIDENGDPMTVDVFFDRWKGAGDFNLSMLSVIKLTSLMLM